MNTIMKRVGIIGASGAAASALAIAGVVAPANAATSDWNGGHNSSDRTSTSSDYSYTPTNLGLFDSLNPNNLPIVVAPHDNSLVSGGVVNGPLVDHSANPNVGDIANGTDVGGVANGSAIASGNDTPVASGNDTSVTAPTASGNDTSTKVGGVDTGNIGSDVGNLVDNTVAGSLEGLNLDGMLGR